MRAWLVLGLAVLVLLAVRLWPHPPAPDGSEVALALPDAPETAVRPGPDADPNTDPGANLGAAPPPTSEAEPSDPPSATLPDIVREAPSTAPPARPGGGVRITLPGGARPGPESASARVVPPAAADPTLTARGAAGTRPAVAADGRTPFAAYRRLQAVGEAGGVAVLLGGLGLDADLTRRALALPPEVSLAFAPYAKDVGAQMAKARGLGHEVLVELPMAGGAGPIGTLGPAALSDARDEAGNARRLDWLLSRSDAYPMVTNYLGGAEPDGTLARQVMTALSESGVAFVDDTGRLGAAARAAGVPYAQVDVVAEDAGNALRTAGRGLAAREVRLVKLYASPGTLSALEAWAGDAPLVPASAKVAVAK